MAEKLIDAAGELAAEVLEENPERLHHSAAVAARARELAITGGAIGGRHSGRRGVARRYRLRFPDAGERLSPARRGAVPGGGPELRDRTAAAPNAASAPAIDDEHKAAWRTTANIWCSCRDEGAMLHRRSLTRPSYKRPNEVLPPSGIMLTLDADGNDRQRTKGTVVTDVPEISGPAVNTASEPRFALGLTHLSRGTSTGHGGHDPPTKPRSTDRLSV